MHCVVVKDGIPVAVCYVEESYAFQAHGYEAYEVPDIQDFEEFVEMEKRNALKRSGLAKLTKEERDALGLY